MKFWDSSALLPLILEEARSVACRALRRADPEIAVWALTRTELTSAIRRLGREGLLEREHQGAALRRLRTLSDRWTEVNALDPVRDRGERALGLHSLTAADALQLAAALVMASDRTRGRTFVTADERLAQAAEAEGFDVTLPAA